MKTKLLSLLCVFLSLPAFAGGGSSIGPSLCHYAALICTTNEASILDRTVVCIFADKQTAGVSLPVDANGMLPYRTFQNVRLQPQEPGVVGAPQIYTGTGFELKYISDAAAQPGYLTVPSLNISELPMKCTTSWP